MAEQTTSLDRIIQQLSPELRQEVEDFAEFLLETRVRKPKQKHFRLDWAGGLREFRDEYTSLELQKKALEWRGD